MKATDNTSGLGVAREATIRHDRGSMPRACRALPFAAIVAGLLFAEGHAGADIYRYVDKDGVIHFASSKADGRYELYMKGRPTARGGGALVAPADKDPSRFTRYDQWIHDAAALYQIPEELVRAVIKVESDYDPRAVSSAGARGLMQLMPDTASLMQVKDIHDPRENIFGGVRFLRILANTFNGDMDLTVAAYNAGENAVVTHGGIPPYAQTRDYVVRVSKYYRRYRATKDIVAASLEP
jgi:hypothetical protein